MSKFFNEGYEAYQNGWGRRADPYWDKGSVKSCPQSNDWCRGWDQARLEEKGRTWEYPFLAKEEMN